MRVVVRMILHMNRIVALTALLGLHSITAMKHDYRYDSTVQSRLLRESAARLHSVAPAPAGARGNQRALVVSVTGAPGDEDYLPDCAFNGFRMREFLEAQGYEVVWLKDCIMEKMTFLEKEVEVIKYTCNKQEKHFIPTEPEELKDYYEHLSNKQNFERELREMTSKTREGDSCFVYVSTHGTRGTETSRCNQILNGILTLGYGTLWNVEEKPEGGNMIWLTDDTVTDETIYDQFTCKLPKGSKGVMMFDACHSGGMGELRFRANPAKSNWSDSTPEWLKGKRTWPKADVISIAAADDHEIAITPRFTKGFLKAVGYWDFLSHESSVNPEQPKDITISDLLEDIRTGINDLEYGNDLRIQTPQMEASRPYLLDYPLSSFMGTGGEHNRYNQCYCLGEHAHSPVEKCDYCTEE